MAAHARAKPRPVLLTGAGALRRVWRGWQRSRPFSGALIAIAGGTEIMLVSLSDHGHSTRVIVPVGTLIAGGILACALLLLFDPAQRSVYATAAILLGASALTTSHLGGYLGGTVLAASGGAMAFAWVPRVPAGRRVRAPDPRLHADPRRRRPGAGPRRPASRPRRSAQPGRHPPGPGRDPAGTGDSRRAPLRPRLTRPATASPCAGRSGPPRPGCAHRASAWQPTGDCARCPATGAAARRSR